MKQVIASVMRFSWPRRAALVMGMAVLLGGATASASVRAARIFSDHMVLQCEAPVPVWGEATPGADVVADFAGQSVQTKANGEGRWRITFRPMKANATGREMTLRTNEDRNVIRDVLVGEVWFAGGQSNMAFSAGQMARRLAEGKALVDGANFGAIRFRKVNERDSPTPTQDLSARSAWAVCSPKTVGRYSAVAFVFARRIHRELGVPVGVIDCSWGGTPIEPYVPAEAFVGHPTLEKLAALARAGDVEGIKAMRGGTFVRSPAWLAGAIYNSRVAPVAPYAIRGAIWYQGESNSGRGEDPRDYAHKMRALIKGWRGAWGRSDLPFYYVQLPQWSSYAWTYLREEQRRVLDVENTGMAVTIDLDNAGDIHPPNKIDVGERLARWPLAKLYSRNVAFSGPLFRGMAVRDGAVVVSLLHGEGGLMVGRVDGVGKVTGVAGGRLQGFELAGGDGAWHAAEAAIEGQAIVVSSPRVPQPVAVRYACRPQSPQGQRWNLYSKAGLPASPFCSDWERMPYEPGRNPVRP